MTFPENEILEILFRKESLIETKSLGSFPQRANSIRQPGAMVMFTREDKMKYIFVPEFQALFCYIGSLMFKIQTSLNKILIFLHPICSLLLLI